MGPIFDKKKIRPDIPGILLLSHGPMAAAVLSSAEMIVGEIDNAVAIGFEIGQSEAEFSAMIREAIEMLPEGTVVLLDIQGGTPCNQLVYIALQMKKECWAVCGLNLPAVIEAVSLRETCSGKELAAQIARTGQEAIVNISEKLRK